ncbi:MAG TPA: CGNR zinc finger domain-containing protein [Acidimicrobiia bacterium]|nr:CGNR zinc finger domain-containing protein [Acidimicrobiia bacterium]
MDFASYKDDSAALAVELVNTYGWVSGVETLHTVDDLRAFLAERPQPTRPVRDEVEETDLEAVKALRTSLHEVFASPEVEGAVAALNRILSASGATPVLSAHDGFPHLHFESATDRLGDWMAVVTAMGVAAVISDEGFDRLGICHADGCRDAFIDTSRNRSRRHCSDGCRNRENVAAYRRRNRAET